jgi:DegV family protein with EDD domain
VIEAHLRRWQEMTQVKIVADSSVCLPKELIEKYGILLVPEKIIFGGTVYRDGLELDHREFYTMLQQAKELPTTSAPSPQDFSDVYRKAAQGADSIACILVTSGFSSMGLKAALIARESFPDVRMEVFDSRTAVGAYGFIVLAAARAAAEGKPLPEVISVAEDMQKRVHLIVALDTLKYLEKGGRIGKAACWAGSLLSIKPILEIPVSSGLVEPVARVRTKQHALEHLLDIMEERVGGEQPVHVSIDHGNAPDEAEWLRSQVLSRFNCAEIFINDFAPVAGVHCGPGVIGLSFYADN